MMTLRDFQTTEDGFPCEHYSSTQSEGSDLWTCDECGQVSRYVPDPNGEIIVCDRIGAEPYPVREEIVAPGLDTRKRRAG
jgi:hypothetical protein